MKTQGISRDKFPHVFTVDKIINDLAAGQSYNNNKKVLERGAGGVLSVKETPDSFLATEKFFIMSAFYELYTQKIIIIWQYDI